ncbi:Gfo/Idh/MocA family protein [Fusobacterium sp. PH5-44]|uniref:Gfo/Idh/MocA family protein n=1 Tax=unclassified Fusobacterium TaxID=2648384 RepID=UPI003D21693F
MKKMKTAIIGCGKVGDFHAKAYGRLDNSVFTAVCDKDINRAKEFALKYGVKAYTDVTQMIKESEIDIVSICTPHPIHAKSAIEAANAGANLLVEKPLASNLEDCDEMIKAAEKNNVVIGTMVQRRFYRPCMRIKKAIEDGKIGKPILGTVTMLGWRDKNYYDSDSWRGTWNGEGGGVLVNQAPHQLDLLLWYMGDIDEVYGIWSNLNHPYIEVEDTAVAVIKFKNGGIGNIVVSNSQNPALYGKVHIHGENGASIGVQTDGGAMFVAGVSTITEPPYNDLWTVQDEEKLLKNWQDEDCNFFNSVDSMYYYHEEQIKDFLSAIIEKRKPLVDGYDGRKTVELFTAIYKSTKERSVIKFPIK